jgi:hypothetical protein
MNTLVDKNISQSQISNPHQVHIDDELNDDNKNNTSVFYRLIRWLHLIKVWKHESVPEVCKHVHKFSLL